MDVADVNILLLFILSANYCYNAVGGVREWTGVYAFLSKPLNKCFWQKAASSSQGVFLGGLIMVLGTSVLAVDVSSAQQNRCTAPVQRLGFGGSTMLVTVLTMLADLIGNNVETGAFVYGAMSFLDKMSNGIAIQIIQICYPNNSEQVSMPVALYYREVMVFRIRNTSSSRSYNSGYTYEERQEHGVADNAWLKSGSWSLVKGPFLFHMRPQFIGPKAVQRPHRPLSQYPLRVSKDLI
ncbi:hypothetical protein OS493_002639 [Desmophyllum pertusum]|uniref:Uncharacterized protein n=1 Tax=Desmophyllum pertusum TaxID=174260 RepID=A0A9X0CPT2_9CNID|nr:hypothetical protein OS493_002639 [Desmophyllum pertusum]